MSDVFAARLSRVNLTSKNDIATFVWKDRSWW